MNVLKQSCTGEHQADFANQSQLVCLCFDTEKKQVFHNLSARFQKQIISQSNVQPVCKNGQGPSFVHLKIFTEHFVLWHKIFGGGFNKLVKACLKCVVV